jgi:hypothetical protein
MKTRSIVLGLVVACLAGTVMAQESDDMYFNRKDRAKLNAEKAKETAVIASNSNTRTTQGVNEEEEEFTATESYSTRNTNPEYTSRSNSEVAQSDNEDYFVSDYQYNTAQNLSRFNSNYSNWYNNPWYTNTYFAPAMYGGWNSPYYAGYYNPWSVYSSPGFYGSVGYSWGSPYYGGYWGSGYNAWDYGYGSYYGNPYGASYYGNSWGYYGGGWNSWGGNNVIIINEGSGRGVAYSKRPSRGGMLNNESASNRTRSQIVSRGDAGGNSGGRVATSNSGRTQQTSGRQDEYYNRSWRRTSEATTNTSSRSAWDNSTPSRTTNTTRSTSDWNSGGSRRTYEPSRSSGSFDTGGSRSGGSSSGGSSSGSSTSGGSGGRTRSH